MTATPEEPDSESWDEMANRVTAEVVNTTYANNLMSAMKAYRLAGFSDAQAWKLVEAEHQSRLEYFGQLSLANLDKEDPAGS